MPRVFERAAVVGVGLIGGSLALAARTAGAIGEVVGVGRGEANLAVAVQRGLVDRATRDPSAVGPVDLVVLAVPLRLTATAARALMPHLAPGTIVTDVGSVKAPIVNAMEAICPADRPFVGGHPIAGTERSGAAAADADLFCGSRCVLTPTARSDAAAVERVAALWRAVGASVEYLSPEEHDRALAWTSHLAHVIAYALARAIDAEQRDLFRYAGPSLRDVTRVAGSSPEMWSDILLTNAGAVEEVTGALVADLERLQRAIGAGDEAAVQALLRAGYAARQRLEEVKR